MRSLGIWNVFSMKNIHVFRIFRHFLAAGGSILPREAKNRPFLAVYVKKIGTKLSLCKNVHKGAKS